MRKFPRAKASIITRRPQTSVIFTHDPFPSYIFRDVLDGAEL